MESLGLESSFFFLHGCPVVPAPLVENLSLLLCFFVKDQSTILMRVYFGVLYSVPVICLFFHHYYTILVIIAS